MKNRKVIICVVLVNNIASHLILYLSPVEKSKIVGWFRNYETQRREKRERERETDRQTER